MILFVTKKKRTRLLRQSLVSMRDWCGDRIEAGDLDLDDTLRPSRDAASVLLDIWFSEKAE